MSPKSGNHGFTLTEVIVVILLASIFVLFVSRAFVYITSGYSRWIIFSPAVGQVRNVSELMDRELRGITSVISLTNDALLYGNNKIDRNSIIHKDSMIFFNNKQVLPDEFKVGAFSFSWKGDSTGVGLKVRFISYSMDILFKNKQHHIASAVFLRSVQNENQTNQ